MIIGKSYKFKITHQLPNTSEDHPCHKEHSHTHELLILVDGPLAENGTVMDYSDIDSHVMPLIGQLTEELDKHIELSTPEVLATWFFESLLEDLPEIAAIEIKGNEYTLARFTMMDHQIRIARN